MSLKGCPDEYPISLIINGYEIAVFQLTNYNLDDWTYGYLFSEGDAVSQIQVCESVMGILKLLIQDNILETVSCHTRFKLDSLDFVAQENGYQAVGEKKQTN